MPQDECVICGQTCDHLDDNGGTKGGLCCNCITDPDVKCDQCKDRSTPKVEHITVFGRLNAAKTYSPLEERI